MRKKKRIIIFGTGLYYERRKDYIKDRIEIIAFFDNNSDLWGREKDGVIVFSPHQIEQLQYDEIVLMSTKSEEMKAQLLELGCKKENIKYYEELCADLDRGRMEIYFGNSVCQNKKNALIAVHLLGYHGASIISSYVASVLQNKGYNVVITATDGEQAFIGELIEAGFKVIIYGGLHYIRNDELFWIDSFDCVIVNTYQMINFAVEVSKIKNCIWWLHEPEAIYKNEFERYKDVTREDLADLRIYAVSKIAQESFCRYYPGVNVGIMHYGIPDKNIDEVIDYNSEKTIFAIIGYVCEVKAQDIFVEAVKKLNEKEKETAEFWIIGRSGGNGFCKNIIDLSMKESSIKILGELNRHEMEDVYSKINVVVNPSREDSCPTVVVEGMMYGKTCITSDNTGMAQFMEDEKNGFICKTGDSDDLYKKLKWILSHRENLLDIGKNARITYKENFTMEKLGDRLINIIEN